MRGTVPVIPHPGKQPRITPACAGNSLPKGIKTGRKKDHPRVCGEQQRLTSFLRGISGSPPRVRGTAAQAADSITVTRITPACAGNSNPELLFTMICKDHPRVCGEQVLDMMLARRMAGSPPRVRGTVPRITAQAADSRITPACAGNRFCPCFHRGWHRDHPRVCGEQATRRVV